MCVCVCICIHVYFLANNLDNPTKEKTEDSKRTKEKKKNVVDSASEKNKEFIKIKKEKKKKNAQCIVLSEEILLDTKVKLCKKVRNDASQANAKNVKRETTNNDVLCNNTSGWEWDVEEIQCDEATKDKRCNERSKLQSIDEMFDSLKENRQCKADVKLEKMKKKREVISKKKQEKMKKQENKKKKKEESKGTDIPDLAFKNFKPKPILDESLDETTCRKNVQEDDITNLRRTVDTEQEPIDEVNNKKMEVNSENYANIKPQFLKTELPDVTGEGEDALDNSEQEEETDRLMTEAFADDKIEEEFAKEKEEEVCRVGILRDVKSYNFNLCDFKESVKRLRYQNRSIKIICFAL